MYEGSAGACGASAGYIDRFRAKATKAKQAQSRIRCCRRMELVRRLMSTTRSISASARRKPAEPAAENGKKSAQVMAIASFWNPSSWLRCPARGVSACWAAQRRREIGADQAAGGRTGTVAR